MDPGEASNATKPAPETAPEAVSVVNAPVLGVVLPIGPGEAWKATKPLPLTVPEAERLTNAPAASPAVKTASAASARVVSAATSDAAVL